MTDAVEKKVQLKVYVPSATREVLREYVAAKNGSVTQSDVLQDLIDDVLVAELEEMKEEKT